MYHTYIFETYHLCCKKIHLSKVSKVLFNDTYVFVCLTVNQSKRV